MNFIFQSLEASICDFFKIAKNQEVVLAAWDFLTPVGISKDLHQIWTAQASRVGATPGLVPLYRFPGFFLVVSFFL